jgi:predicted RecA/RadA family phage recombinase
VEEFKMKNKIQDGQLLHVTVGSAIVAGDPVVVGHGIRGVAATSYLAADGKAVIDTEGVFDLLVQAVDDDGNSAIVVGDRLYHDGTTTTLSKKKSGYFFGIALEAVTSGATDTINVDLPDICGVDKAASDIFRSGTYTVVASPAPSTTTTILVSGLLSTDIAIVQQGIDQAASPSNKILSAAIQVSPSAIIVTTEGIPTAGDTFNYMVLRAAI